MSSHSTGSSSSINFLTYGYTPNVLKHCAQQGARPRRGSSARLVLLMVSWSKFKTAPALKGPDGVLCILPSGSIIFVLWTPVLSTAPHPAASPGSGLSWATFGITHVFSYFQLLLIGGFFFGGRWCLYFNNYLFRLNDLSLCLILEKRYGQHSGLTPPFNHFILFLLCFNICILLPFILTGFC